MKGNFVKVLMLLVLVFVAYKSLGKGLKAFTSHSAVTTPEVSEIPLDTAPESLLPSEQAGSASSATEAKVDILGALNDYGRVPFIPSTGESKIAKQGADISPRTTAYVIPELTTTLNYEGKWFAIVNGNLVKAGDKVGRVTILDIKENQVKIEEAGRTFELKLWQEGISK